MHHHLILRFLVRYKYRVIFPVAAVEGPIITVIAGVLIARGQLDVIPTFAIIFAADMVSDPALYLLGRFGRHLAQKIAFVGVSKRYLEKLENQYARHPWKTMIVGKLSYGLGSLFVVAAGAARMPWPRFLSYMGTLDVVKSCLLLCLGYFYGRAILHLSSYLQYYAMAVVILLPLAHWLFISRHERA